MSATIFTKSLHSSLRITALCSAVIGTFGLLGTQVQSAQLNWLKGDPEDWAYNYYNSGYIRFRPYFRQEAINVSATIVQDNVTFDGTFQFGTAKDTSQNHTISDTYSSTLSLGSNKFHVNAITSTASPGILASAFRNEVSSHTHNIQITGTAGSAFIFSTQKNPTKPNYDGVDWLAQLNDGVNFGFDGVETIKFQNGEVGFSVASQMKDDRATTLSVDNASHFEVSTTEGEAMRRAILVGGDSQINLKTKESIRLAIDEGWSEECRNCSGKQLGSGLITGNGNVSLESKNVELSGFSANSEYHGYAKSWAIQATASMVAEPSCALGTKDTLNSADISIKASEQLLLQTNWGGISSDSTADHFSRVSLQGKVIDIDAAGMASSDEIAEGFTPVQSSIRAISKGQESTISIQGENVAIDFKEGLLGEKGLHHLLYAEGEKANIVISGQYLQLGVNASIEQLALANEGAQVRLNLDEQSQITGAALMKGALIAQNGGTINLGLGEGSQWTGAAVLNSAVTVAEDKDRDGEINIDAQGGARWNVLSHKGKDSIISSLTIQQAGHDNSSFEINFADNKHQKVFIKELVGSEKGKAEFNVRMNLEDQTGQLVINNDKVIVSHLQGEHDLYVNVNNHAINPPASLQAAWLATNVAPDFSNGEFLLSNEGGLVDIGLYKYELASEEREDIFGAGTTSKYWYLKKTDEKTPPVQAVEAVAGSHRFLHWADLQDLRKRIGEVRYGTQTGAWARLVTQRDKARSQAGLAGLEQDYEGINVGFDTKFKELEDQKWLVGLSFTYGQAEQEIPLQKVGTGETDRYGVNVYASWTRGDGSYADFVLSADRFEQEITTRANAVIQKGDFDTWGAGLSAEVGRMFMLSSGRRAYDHWSGQTWIEPQLQLAYYYLDGVNYRLSGNGIRVENESDESLLLRAGVVLGSRWQYGDLCSKDPRYVQFYLKGGVKHDMMGEYTLVMNGERLSKSIGQTTGYYGIGADWQLSERARAYVQVEREKGDGYTKKVEASVGLKWML